ncbi:hypothetical protein Y695_02996 [Hydrogenophaga sp. T4]|nr:hypothetical protein Y695_02996 [Hydrogenophaga sp. T4]
MTGAEGLQDVAVVLAALVGVADQQGDRRAGGLALVHATEDFHRVGLVALGDEFRRAGAAAVQIGLDVGLGQGHAGRQPSITQPMAGPWDSPKLVTQNKVPKVLPLIVDGLSQRAVRVPGWCCGAQLGAPTSGFRCALVPIKAKRPMERFMLCAALQQSACIPPTGAPHAGPNHHPVLPRQTR